MIWFLLRTSFVISNSEWYKDDTNMRERCLTEMFWAVWSSPRQSCLQMTRDSGGYVGSNVQRAQAMWWIIPRNVNDFGCVAARLLWRVLCRGVCRTNNGNTKRPACVGSPTGVSCKYALTILLQPHQSCRIWQGPFVPNKECKHSWSMLGEPFPPLSCHYTCRTHCIKT